MAFDEVGIADVAGHVRQDPAFMRPADVVELRGDSTKAREDLGWEPTTSFEEIIRRMVRADIARLSSGIEESPDYL